MRGVRVFCLNPMGGITVGGPALARVGPALWAWLTAAPNYTLIQVATTANSSHYPTMPITTPSGGATCFHTRDLKF